MNKTLLIILFSILAISGGFGLIVAADTFGWFPQFESSTHNAVASARCKHRIAADRCPFCNPDLVESMGWCQEHGVPEALCTKCSSSIVPAFEARNDWCAEHGLPESLCRPCGADPGAQFATIRGDTESSIQVQPVADYSGMLRASRPPSGTCDKRLLTVQLASSEIARRSGLLVEPVSVESVEEVITGNAQVRFDGDRYARLASRAPGIVSEVLVDLGNNVMRGDILAEIDSAEIGTAKAAYLQALTLVDLWTKNYDRERTLYEKNVGIEKDMLEAETKLMQNRVALSSARQHLYNLGLSEDDLAWITNNKDTTTSVALRAPFDGTVVDRRAVSGEVVSTSQPLFSIADTSTMWVMVDINESDYAQLRTGASVQLTLDALPERTLTGELTWISAEVDPRTRTIRGRAEFDNPDGVMRANMFGRARVVVESIKDAILVPESAIQWEGCCNVVFVRHTDTVFQPYPVTLGSKHGSRFVVRDGLPPGESIVTQGSFLLKTEILKGNIGAGCCEVDPGADM